MQSVGVPRRSRCRAHTQVLAQRAPGEHEFDFNLRLAKLFHQKLVAAGFDKTMLLVTESTHGWGLDQRVAGADKTGADLYLSIHHDSCRTAFWGHGGSKDGSTF